MAIPFVFNRLLPSDWHYIWQHGPIWQNVYELIMQIS